MIISENKRVIAGVCVLLVVNIIWVLSSELTNYIFITEKYNKPFLTTYLKSSMFSLLLLGFMCSTHWKMLACPQKYYSHVCSHIQSNEANDEQHDDILGEPTYLPLNHESSDDDRKLNPDDDFVMVNHQEGEDSQQSCDCSKRSVKFCKYKEVRHLSETYAEESLAARLSYNASKILKKRLMMRKLIDRGFFPATVVMKLAVQFCFCWFVASYAYQKSLSTTLPAVVNVVSSTSSLFTLILAAFFPSSDKDKFSITKLFVVFLSIGGVALISFSQFTDSSGFHYEGIIWGLVGAIGYAIYLVNLRRNVKNEEQMSISMFLGFVGLWTVLSLWPGFFLFNWTEYETFELPNKVQLGSILLNGLLGTVGAELMWLWGCFLTSSLTATLSMGLTIPLTMVTDYIIKRKVYNWIFYVGSIPILVSFISVAYLTNGDGPPKDPLGSLFRCIFCSNSTNARYEPLPDSDLDIVGNDANIVGDDRSDSADRLSVKKPLSLFFAGLFSLSTTAHKLPNLNGSETKGLLINESRDNDEGDKDGDN